MNRPMEHPYEENEEEQRRRDYAEILMKAPYSEMVGRCDPKVSSAYPARILKWQYAEGLLVNHASGEQTRSRSLFSVVSANAIIERRSELARRLAIFLVAKEARMSPDYLRKLCRKEQGSEAEVSWEETAFDD
jgi:hypothetical protein